MINFHGSEWAALKQVLLASREKKIELLVLATDHDTSNKIRGAIAAFDELLRLEKAAFDAANQRT